jgi:hypothetical protein
MMKVNTATNIDAFTCSEPLLTSIRRLPHLEHFNRRGRSVLDAPPGVFSNCMPSGHSTPPRTFGPPGTGRPRSRRDLSALSPFAALFTRTLIERLGPDFLFKDLAERLRCTECNAKGMAQVYESGR